MGRKVVVFLGNVGFGQRIGWKSEKYAKLAPKIEFIGIDLGELKRVRPKNLRQIQANFEDGLRRLQDNSVSLIRSDLAVGHYDAKGNQKQISEEKMPLNEENPYFVHTRDTLKIAYRKLERNGKFVATCLNDRALAIVMKALEETPFKKKQTNYKVGQHGEKISSATKNNINKNSGS